MIGLKTTNNPGLYIHIPFCRTKCPYCAFFSVTSTSLIDRWMEAFRKEVLYYKDRFNRFDSLYFGGGTPSALETSVLASLMDYIAIHFDFESDSEVSIEANPCDLNREKVRALKDMGFNRVSLGVQSFDDRILSFLGRNHTATEAEAALLSLRSVGFNDISIDLIFGLEKQATKEWLDTLKRAISFQPEHLSCYQLTFNKKTLFGRLKDRGVIQPLSEREEASFFLATSQFLEDNGYIHYEISSFARDDFCRSRHNYKYWQHTPYLGLGPSAHSFYESRRWWNVRSVRKYCEALKCGRAPVEGSENLSDEQLSFESIILGLRTYEGFAQNRLTLNYQSREMLSGLQNTGFLRFDSERVIPTKMGFLVADYLACCLGG